MIQPVVVYCSTTESDVASPWSFMSFAEARTAPPTEWTIHFGAPVVPEE